MTQHKSKDQEEQIDDELIEMGKDAASAFDLGASITVEPKKTESKLISIRLPRRMLEELRAVAELRGEIGYQSLIKTFISEGLKRERKPVQPQQALAIILNTSAGQSGEYFDDAFGAWKLTVEGTSPELVTER